MQKLKIVRIDGKCLTLSKANLNQLAAIASLGFDFKNMKGEDIGEAAPLMIEIVKDCLHSSKYEVSEDTAVGWINKNLDLDALIEEASSNVEEDMIRDNGSTADDFDDFDGLVDDELNRDGLVDDELNRLVSLQMPNTVFLGDMDVQSLAKLFAQTMPKKKTTKRSKKAKAG